MEFRRVLFRSRERASLHRTDPRRPRGTAKQLEHLALQALEFIEDVGIEATEQTLEHGNTSLRCWARFDEPQTGFRVHNFKGLPWRLGGGNCWRGDLKRPRSGPR